MRGLGRSCCAMAVHFVLYEGGLHLFVNVCVDSSLAGFGLDRRGG